MNSDGEVFAMKNEGLINNRYESSDSRPSQGSGGFLKSLLIKKICLYVTIWTKLMVVSIHRGAFTIYVDKGQGGRGLPNVYTSK